MVRLRTGGKPSLPIDPVLRNTALLFRVLGWIWMAILIALTPSSDPGADIWVTWGTMVLVTVWTVLTWWATRANELASLWFVVGDVLITAFVGIAPTLAGAENLFHGGWLNSNLFIVAYAFNMRVTIGAGVLIGVEQVLAHWIDGRGVVPAAGSVGFLVIGILVGWVYDELRRQERRRLAVQSELDEAVATQARHAERLDLADRLHDSVLQTLAALRRDAEDAGQVRYLARRQERELRRTISEYRSPYRRSARAEIRTICGEVEDLHRIVVEAVIRGDAECDERLMSILTAAREALMNGAKHAGVESIDLYAELGADRGQIFVRDRGRGFDPESAEAGRGMEHSLRRRAEAADARVVVSTAAGKGTEVEIVWSAS